MRSRRPQMLGPRSAPSSDGGELSAPSSPLPDRTAGRLLASIEQRNWRSDLDPGEPVDQSFAPRGYTPLSYRSFALVLDICESRESRQILVGSRSGCVSLIVFGKMAFFLGRASDQWIWIWLIEIGRGTIVAKESSLIKLQQFSSHT